MIQSNQFAMHVILNLWLVVLEERSSLFHLDRVCSRCHSLIEDVHMLRPWILLLIVNRGSSHFNCLNIRRSDEA